MNASHVNQDNSEIRQRLAAEVIELGENLFEMALEVGTHQPTQGEETMAYPIEEIQAATNEFFIALRLLLGVAE